MMLITKFINTLLPKLGKDRILEDIKVTIGELENIVLPSYHQAETFLDTHKLKSDSNKALETLFYKTYKLKGNRKGKTIVHDIHLVLPPLIENLKLVQKLVDEIFAQDTINDGLTAKKANLLRTAEAISFASNYMLDLLNLIYVNESEAAGTEIDEDMRLAPVIIRDIESGIGKFALIMDRWAIKHKDFARLIGTIPDVVISESTQAALRGSYTDRELDPFGGFLLSNFVGNPIYHIRLNIAEWQTRRYKANKDKKKVLELRRLHAEYLNEGKNDPKLENEINYLQGRIDKVARSIKQVEDSVGGI